MRDQNAYYVNRLKPLFQKNGFAIVNYGELSLENTHKVNDYFNKTIYPMLTPMVFDSYHTFPVLMNNRLLFGVVTKESKRKSKPAKGFIHPGPAKSSEILRDHRRRYHSIRSH